MTDIEYDEGMKIKGEWLGGIYFTEPEFYYPITDEKRKRYVFAFCMCEVPISHAIIIPRKNKCFDYTWHCNKCGMEGHVSTNGV